MFYTDTFTEADQDLGAPWNPTTTVNGKLHVYSNALGMAWVSGSPSIFATYDINGNGVNWALGNQSAQCTVINFPTVTDEVDLFLRGRLISSAVMAGYSGGIQNLGTGNSVLLIVRYNTNGSNSTLASSSAFSTALVTDGSILSFSVVGATLTLTLGTRVLSTTDTNFTIGNPGLGLSSTGANTTGLIDSWTGGFYDPPAGSISVNADDQWLGGDYY